MEILDIDKVSERFDDALEKMRGVKSIPATEFETIRQDVDTAITKARLDPSPTNFNAAQGAVNLMESYTKAEQKASFYKGAKDFHKGMSNTFRDQASQFKKEADHNKALLGTDKLTSIPNRAAFDEQLATAIATNGKDAISLGRGNDGAAPQGQKNFFALVMVDLDRFKGLNDDHGHDAGDVALQTFATKLQNVVRGDKDEFFGGRSRIARLGGDEFAIIMNAQAETRDDAMKQFEPGLARINRELEGTHSTHNNKSFPIVATLGMHVLENDDTAKTAYNKADQASLAAKHDKIERYERAVALLESQGVENLQVVEDKRAKEGLTPLTKEQVLAVAEALQAAGGSLTSDKSLKDAVDTLAVEKTLEQFGLEITYDDDEPRADSKPDDLDPA